MIYYNVNKVYKSVEDMRKKKMTHMEILKKNLPEILKPDVDNSFSSCTKKAFSAVVFNMETGDRLDRIIPYLLKHIELKNADIILANELDYGMKRSSNIHTTRELAKVLNMNYAYGVEFITENAGKNQNELGMHGNAILSKYPLHNVFLIHLPIEYEWFYRQDDCRIGVRVAVVAEIEVDGKRMGLCSVHLENRTTPQGRERQLRFLLEEIENKLGNLPVLIGGDMNTNMVDGDSQGPFEHLRGNEKAQQYCLGIVPAEEPLMNTALNFGYSYEDCNIMKKITRRKPMPDGSKVVLNLDWFFQKGLTCCEPKVVDTVFDHLKLEDGERYRQFDGQELSDHNAITVRCMI